MKDIDKVLTAMRAHPERVWNVRQLGRACGLKGEALQSAIRSARFKGRIDFHKLMLSASMRDDAAKAADIQSKDQLAGDPATGQQSAGLSPRSFHRLPSDLAGDDTLSVSEGSRAALAAFDAAYAMAPKGATLGSLVREAAKARGVTMNDLLRPMTPNGAVFANKIVTLVSPKPATVAKVRAVLAGLPMPEEEAGGSKNDDRHARGVTRAAAVRAEIEARRIAAVTDRTERARVLQAAVDAEAVTVGGARRAAQSTGTVCGADRLRLTPAETLSTAFAETPGDAVKAVQRAWPETWQRVLLAARDQRVTPGAMMMTAIERGLAA